MRLFTAICFDEETKKALFSAAKAAENFSSGNFTREGNLHLTLVFIGETERENEIKSALSEVEFPSFEIKTEGIGLFEKGILYIGTEKNEKLEKLQKTVFKKLKNLGLEIEEREYVPHITLARKFRPEEDFSGAEIIKRLPEKPVCVNRISLMKSERTEGVLQYTEIWSKQLF